MENIYNHYRNIVADACLRIDELKIVDHEEVKKSDLLSSSFIVEKPGFINFRLKHKILIGFLRGIVEKENLISEDIGRGKSINVEYVSANPTGPLHVGHCRGAVYGDVLSSLLIATGHNVTKEYYVNDAGSQIDLLAKSVLIRYKELFDGQLKEYPDDFYPGDYLIPVAEEIKKEYGDKLISDDENLYQ